MAKCPDCESMEKRLNEIKIAHCSVWLRVGKCHTILRDVVEYFRMPTGEYKRMLKKRIDDELHGVDSASEEGE